MFEFTCLFYQRGAIHLRHFYVCNEHSHIGVVLQNSQRALTVGGLNGDVPHGFYGVAQKLHAYHVVFGNVMQTSADAIYLARHVGLCCGAPNAVPALTLNRLCGSGFQAIITAAEQILTGQGDLILAGGSENMSQSPHIVRGARWGIPLGKGELEDYLCRIEIVYHD